jgi:hypothetical protein
MSVNPEDMTNAPMEYVDLEHQVIRQKIDVEDSGAGTAFEALPGQAGAEFDPGERQLDREELARLVYYRSYATAKVLEAGGDPSVGFDYFLIVDASVGINGDLFRPVTNQETVTTDPDDVPMFVDTGGEIGLLDHYELTAKPGILSDTSNGGAGFADTREHTIEFYDWPTSGPIVDSFDTITCGFGGNFAASGGTTLEGQVELRYDFWWDVRDTGRTTSPFGRP